MPSPAFFNPNSFMFFAAFKSLSWLVRQFAHVHFRSARVNVSFFSPHAEQVLLLASNLPILIRFFPYQSHLYSICLKNSLKDTSLMAWDRLLFLSIPFTCKSSITNVSVWLSRINRDVIL